MTTRAREALADCEHALDDFEASANTFFQRPRWVAVMTLLRTVGLVLKAVDHPAATAIVQQRIDDAWKRLADEKPKPGMKPHIFHDFIDAERHQAVHLYEVRSQINVTVRPGSAWYDPRTGETGGSSGEPPIFDFIMRDGPFKGRDPRELCREAITFWREYLDAIDSGT